jgi:hypothetical protein
MKITAQELTAWIALGEQVAADGWTAYLKIRQAAIDAGIAADHLALLALDGEYAIRLAQAKEPRPETTTVTTTTTTTVPVVA